MAIKWTTAPAVVTVKVNITGGFPPPDVTATVSVAGPDLANPTPTNYGAPNTQTQTQVAIGSAATFTINLTAIGYYQLQVSITITNQFGTVTIPPTIVQVGLGQTPSGTVS